MYGVSIVAVVVWKDFVLAVSLFSKSKEFCTKLLAGRYALTAERFLKTMFLKTNKQETDTISKAV